MRNLDYNIDVKAATDWVNLWFYGDQHYGSIACSESEMDATIAAIRADPLSRVVLMGDCCDFINVTDRRFDIQQVAPRYRDKLDDLAKAQADGFIEKHRPIMDKLVCLIPGNHDECVRMRYHFDVAGYIAACLCTPVLSTVAQLRVRVQGPHRHTYLVKGVVSHAEKGAVTVGGKVTGTNRMADYYGNHDFFAQAHTHEYLVHEGRNMDVGGAFRHGQSPRTTERTRIVFLTGGYLKTYADGRAGYGERRGYRPCRLGSPRLQMRMNRTTDQPELRGV